MAAFDNIVHHINAMPASRKTAILAVIVVSIASMLLLFSFVQKADHQVLYANLSEEDAGRIVQELKEKKIPYQLGATGTVLVPADRVYDLRLQLASQGLPQGGGVGFEIFDNTSFTTSEFVQKLNYRRALEGELSRTIKSLSGVQQGRVHLVIPERSLFALQDDRPKTSAAVFVTLEKGRKLSSSEVEAVVHLVSGSVEGLAPENITIIDNKGSLLTKPSEGGVMALSGSQLEYQHGYEKDLTAKIVSILEPVAGRGKVNARVSATFDFTRSERTEEKFDPEGVVVRSEQKSTEKTTSGGPGGVPGVSSNLPGGSADFVSALTGQSQKQDETINYETSKTITRVIDSPISLERLSVAIIIDGILDSQKGTVENPDQYAVRTEEDMRYYEDIVKKTMGFTAERGDEVSVTVMPFETVTFDAEEPGRDYMPIVITALKYVVLPLFLFVMFFIFIVRPLMSSLTRSIPRTAPGGGTSPGPEEIEHAVHPREIGLEKQVIEWANSNTEQAAGLVKGWLQE